MNYPFIDNIKKVNLNYDVSKAGEYSKNIFNFSNCFTKEYVNNENKSMVDD